VALTNSTAALAKAFREHDLPVMLVNVTGRASSRTDADGRGCQGSTGTLPAGWADIIEDPAPQPGDHLITKRPCSAFHNTGLNTSLGDLGVTQIVLTGVPAGGGVSVRVDPACRRRGTAAGRTSSASGTDLLAAAAGRVCAGLPAVRRPGCCGETVRYPLSGPRPAKVGASTARA
jgi:Isochorismatase family